MLFRYPITLRLVIKLSLKRVALTWLIVLAENVLMMLLPLFIGFAIDGLLEQNLRPLLTLGFILFALVVISVARRVYDTRVYGAIRVRLAKLVARNLRAVPISVKDARLTMSRELVDFLEQHLPAVITALVQLLATLVILASFHFTLALCVLAAGLAMLLLYTLFHRTFTRLNATLNDQLEQQVGVLDGRSFAAIRAHFERLKQCEIKLSDTEALVYGLIFIALFSSVVANLWLVSHLPAPTAGQVFAVVTYSLEFVETAVMLPITLQTLSRLEEISQRLNQPASNLATLEHTK
ncbi:ABC transporter permease [Vibrio cidicii]|uniref:ABC transporter six-transmembrane domain-containing protein n=1 Tax=Vibrio cidicii TaxID=1763883 RepID=UPI0018C1DFD3|nr:ABC transporter six-transmembrane domain-containing protein [Vibrio cidicii]MBG0758424.1 ABC transporter permease [Vibrio cidicii]